MRQQFLGLGLLALQRKLKHLRRGLVKFRVQFLHFLEIAAAFGRGVDGRPIQPLPECTAAVLSGIRCVRIRFAGVDRRPETGLPQFRGRQ